MWRYIHTREHINRHRKHINNVVGGLLEVNHSLIYRLVHHYGKEDALLALVQDP